MSAPSAESPYKGLASFTVDDAPYFFGRALERDLLDAHIRGSRLTILYGASGAGKSSLLQAGLMGQLRRVAVENRRRNRPPRIAVALINMWTADPRADIVHAAAGAVQEALGSTAEPPAVAGALPEALHQLTGYLGGTLVLIFDQFEDFLAECWRSGTAGPFGGELAALVDTPGLRVHVLICVQEEWLARLDILEKHIPTWLARSMRLEHLRAASAREAMVRPLDAWNAVHGLSPDRMYRAEEPLVDELLQYASRESAPTATAYLQLILKRLWDEEMLRDSRELRHTTLQELGGPDEIVMSHLDSALSGLSRREKEAVGEILRALVTADGQRKSLTTEQLASPRGAGGEAVEAIIGRLDDTGARIIRSVADGAGVMRYEIFHQVLVGPVMSWLAAAERKRTEREKERSRLLLRWVGAAAVVVIAFAAAIVAWRYRFTSEERQNQAARMGLLIRQAEALRPRQLDLALLLALHARENGGASKADRFLAQTLASPAASSRFLGWSDAPVLKIVTAPRDAAILAANKAGALWNWPIASRVQPGESFRLDWGSITEAAFSRDGTTVATSAPDQTTRLRSTVDALFPIVSFATPSVSSIALSADGHVIAVGDAKGTVRLSGRNGDVIENVTTGAASPIEALDVSADGTLLAAGAADGSVHVSRISRQPATAITLTESKAAIQDISFSPDGRMLVAGAEAGKVHLWSREGTRWTHDTLPAGRSGIVAVAFDRSGAFVAAGDVDGTIRVWSAFTGQVAGQPLQGHVTPVRSLAFASRDRLFAAQEDGSVRVWTTSTVQPVPVDFPGVRQVACRIAGRDLTADEWARYIGDTPQRRVCP